jgi:hypothetical protein
MMYGMKENFMELYMKDKVAIVTGAAGFMEKKPLNDFYRKAQKLPLLILAMKE